MRLQALLDDFHTLSHFFGDFFPLLDPLRFCKYDGNMIKKKCKVMICWNECIHITRIRFHIFAAFYSFFV